MPFWPWYMAACVGLILWGYRAGAAVFAPVAILCGLIVMRFVVLLPDHARELAAFTPWLCVAYILMYKGAWLPGVLCLLSGATYPVLLTLGLRIEYLGLAPIIADAFLIAALGLWGLAIYSHTSDNRDRVDHDGASVAVGMAESKGLRHANYWGGAKMKAGR